MLGNGECSILDIRIKTMEKKVKVLLSAYNGEKYIVEQVESILNQTYQNIELYIRDDGSKDNTLKVLKPKVKLKKLCQEISICCLSAIR